MGQSFKPEYEIVTHYGVFVEWKEDFLCGYSKSKHFSSASEAIAWAEDNLYEYDIYEVRKELIAYSRRGGEEDARYKQY